MKTDIDDGGFTRRKFFRKLWAAVGLLAGAELAAILFGFLKPGKRRSGSDIDRDIVSVGPAADIASDSVTAVRKGRFYLVRFEDGGFLALTQQCSHLGCSVAWNESENKFNCPCHASSFDKQGDVLSPPAPHALDSYPVLIENGIVKVDVSEKIRRGSFQKDQVTYV